MTKDEYEKLALKLLIQSNVNFTDEQKEVLKYIVDELYKEYQKIEITTHWLSPGGDGAEVIYALRNSDNLSRRITDEFVKSGQNVRKYYQRRLPSDSSKDYYYMLRNTPNNETIIVEYGFADSTGDDVAQIKNNWQGLTEAVVKALAGYVGVPYTPPTGGTGNIPSGNTYIVKKGDTIFMGNNGYKYC